MHGHRKILILPFEELLSAHSACHVFYIVPERIVQLLLELISPKTLPFHQSSLMTVPFHNSHHKSLVRNLSHGHATA